MPYVPPVPRVSLDVLPEIEARWSTLEAMSPAAWSAVEKRVSVCLDCLGPALLSDDELEFTIAAPRCRRCREAVAA